MKNKTVIVRGPEKNRRKLHWVVTTAFFFLFFTGVIMYVPAFSGLAAGGWTRLLHRGAAVVLAGAPIIYIFISPSAARLWIKEAMLLKRKSAALTSTFKGTHKVLIITGFILFLATGMIQWFLKGIVPNQVFQWSLSIHDIIFLGAVIVLLFHIYFEFDWWLWKRRYCNNCTSISCADTCPEGALMRSSDNRIEYYPQRCTSCRLCKDYCRLNSYHKKAVRTLAD